MVCSKIITINSFYKQYNWYVNGTLHCASLTFWGGGGGRGSIIIENS